MKKIILLAAVLLQALAGSPQELRTVLQSTVTAFDTSSVLDQKMAMSNKLGLIAKKYKQEWVAPYYAAYSRIRLSHDLKDAARRDALLDEADAYLDEAAGLLDKPHDEILVLRAMAASARLSVDPQNRWERYGKAFEDHIGQAKALNANNPRIHLLQGISKFYTPKMFGGGRDAAMPYFRKAEGLFASQTAEDIMTPFWGRQVNEWFMAQQAPE
jgi:hypothetical protein